MTLDANDQALVAQLRRDYEAAEPAKRAALRRINDDALGSLRSRRLDLERGLRVIDRAIALRKAVADAEREIDGR